MSVSCLCNIDDKKNPPKEYSSHCLTSQVERVALLDENPHQGVVIRPNAEHPAIPMAKDFAYM